MKIYLKMSLALTIVIYFTLTSSILGQEWSAEQKEVWSSVEDYWELAAKGELDGFLSYFHSSFSGWANGSADPQNKTNREKVLRHFLPKSTTAFYTITPQTIWVQGNFAFVHYNYTEVEVDMEGKEQFNTGRWTDILMKDGDRWVMVGDSGGQTSSNN